MGSGTQTRIPVFKISYSVVHKFGEIFDLISFLLCGRHTWEPPYYAFTPSFKGSNKSGCCSDGRSAAFTFMASNETRLNLPRDDVS